MSDTSNLMNTLREAISHPEKAKEAMASLQEQLPSMSEDQKKQAMALVEQLKDKVGSLSEEGKAQLSSLMSRFSK